MNNRASLLVFTALVSTFYASAAVAADQATTPQKKKSDYVYTLPSVTVTATRTSFDPFMLPGSADVVTLDGDLATRNNGDVGKILRRMPNVGGQGGPRSEVEQLNIRGQDDRRVVSKVDGQRQNFRAEYKGRSFIDPEFLKSVEVVRGPNSVLDGSGAIGGSVQYLTKSARDMLDAGQTVGARVKTGYNSNNKEFSTNLSAYTAGDFYDVFAGTGFSNNDDLKLSDDTTLDFSNQNRRTNLLKGKLFSGDRASIEAAFNTYRSSGQATSNAIRSGAAGGFAENKTTTTEDSRLTTTYKAPNNNWVDIKAMMFNAQTWVNETITQTGSALGRNDDSKYFSRGADVYNTSRFTLAGIQNTLTYGTEMFWDNQAGRRGGAASRQAFYPAADMQNYAGYIQNEMRLGDWSFIPGLRYDDYELSAVNNSSKNKDQAVSGKMAVGYDINSIWGVYGNVAQAFRAPLLAEAYSGGTISGLPTSISATTLGTLATNPDLKPEKALNKEIGVRAKFDSAFYAGDSIKTKISVFQNDVDGLIERQRDGVDVSNGNRPLFRYKNIDSARLQGIEWEGNYSLDGWFANLALSYTDGKNRTANTSLLDVPPAKATLDAGREFKLVDNSNLLLGWQVEAAATQNAVPANELLVGRTGGYTVHNIYASWQPDWAVARDLRINMGVDNLFDKSYRQHTDFIASPGVSAYANVAVKF